MELLDVDATNKQIKFEVHCSKGTYIRTLCEDVASRLGTVGYMSDLNRVQVGEFNLQNAIKIEDLKNGNINNFISIEEFFEKSDKIILDENDLTRFLNGVKIFYRGKNVGLNVGLKSIYNTKGDFVGIGTVKDGQLKRDIIV